MLSIENYTFPSTLAEAYQLLQADRKNTILGGCHFLKMGGKKIATAIDLARLELDFIREKATTIEIGAMTTFRALETSPLLAAYFNGILPKSVRDIVGVQFRNMATLGATVYSRYGFSDLITALLALDAAVVLYQAGQVPLAEFLRASGGRDILVKVIIPKTDRKAAFQMMRNSYSDFAILNVAVSRKDDDWKVVVGARPQQAAIAKAASAFLAKSNLTSDEIEQAAVLAAEELTFSSNIRGSQDYRAAVCRILVQRAILEVLG